MGRGGGPPPALGGVGMSPVQSLIQPDLLAQAGFAAIVALTFAGALIAVFPRNIIYNILGLIVCLTGVAGLFVYLGSPFIALMQLLIYVGAICISIIFAIMLSRPLHLSVPKRRLPKVGLAAASIEVRAFNVATIPALAILTVCCSMAS